MKVAVVYHFFPHYRAAVLRELLRSSEHDYLLVADNRPVDPTIKAWTVEEPGRFMLAPCRTLTASFLWQKKLLNLSLRRDLDAVIYLGNPYFLATWLSAPLARLAGKRVFFWTHGWTRLERGPKAWFRKAFYKLAHALLLYGHAAKMSGLAKGFSAENLHVIYNSLDYDRQRQLRKGVTEQELVDLRQQLFGAPDRPVIVCCARITRTCRLDLLLEAQARLCAEGHRVNVVLIGDGPERATLEALAARLHLPVHFHGACYDEPTLARFIMAARVTVTPGKVGLTAMQSLAYGTPVITHDDFEAQGPEWEAILPGRTGDFFRRGDVTELARVIKTWTAEPVSTSRVRTDCHRVLERFYTPAFQRRAIDRAVSGHAADDLFWMKESFQ